MSSSPTVNIVETRCYLWANNPTGFHLKNNKRSRVVEFGSLSSSSVYWRNSKTIPFTFILSSSQMTRIKPNQFDETGQPKTSCNTLLINNNIANNTDDPSNCQRNDAGDENDQTNRQPVANSILALASAANCQLTRQDNYDLRPKFAILKHKSEILNTSSSSVDNTKRTYPKTPDWFFNIPTTRSPFPDFASRLPADETEE